MYNNVIFSYQEKNKPKTEKKGPNLAYLVVTGPQCKHNNYDVILSFLFFTKYLCELQSLTSPSLKLHNHNRSPMPLQRQLE